MFVGHYPAMSAMDTLSGDLGMESIGRGNEDEERKRRDEQKARGGLGDIKEELQGQNIPQAGVERATCVRCNLAIVTKQVNALDQAFHPECFRCVQCDKVLVEEFRNRRGTPYCNECYQVRYRWNGMEPFIL